jgi:hypothetical protein
MTPQEEVLRSYINRLVDERDELSRQLEIATSTREAAEDRASELNHFISIATPELLAALPLSGRKVWRDRGFSRAQAKVMVILSGVSDVIGWSK